MAKVITVRTRLRKHLAHQGQADVELACGHKIVVLYRRLRDLPRIEIKEEGQEADDLDCPECLVNEPAAHDRMDP